MTGTKISEKSSFWKDGCILSTALDIRIRYEALMSFVAFSPDNLKLFCKNQVQARMGAIVGDISAPYSKYIKELHIQRHDLQSTFKKFLASDASVFGMVRDAGVGKTSAICSLALQMLETGIVFFYNAALINKSPSEHIAQDLNLTFSSRSENDTILKKLDELGRYLNQDIIIFIDAIDEHTGSNIALELSETALIARNLERIKVCVSCKSNIWNSVLGKNDNPTHLFEELQKFHLPISKLNNCPGFLLEDFSNDELNSILPLYQKTFGFKGQISDSILKELRNGFFLRIFSEVYSQREVPQELNDKELIKKYLNQSLEKTDLDIPVAIRILSKIGDVLTKHKYTSWEAYNDDGIEIETIIDNLDFSIVETIPEDLFSRNLLIRSSKDSSYTVSFYYSKIRDYIICFHSYKLDKLNDDVFHDSIDELYKSYIGVSAIEYYLQVASSIHKKTYKKYIKDQAIKYVNKYNSYLETHLKVIKSKFDPNNEGSIGILLPDNILRGGGYALLPLESETEDIVQYENFEGEFRFDHLFSQRNIKRVSSGSYSGFISDQSKKVRKDVFGQLEKILRDEKLIAYNSDTLLLERLSIELYYDSEKLGYNYKRDDFYFPRWDLIYPIDLEELKERVYRLMAFDYFKSERYSKSLKYDSEAIEKEVNKAVESNMVIPKWTTSSDLTDFEELYSIIMALIKKGYSLISEHHLPCADIALDDVKALQQKERKFESSQIRSSQFSRDQAKTYIECFLRYFDKCYGEFIDYHFSTFKHSFEFYNTLPHEYFVYMKDSDILKWGELGYRQSSEGEANVVFKECTFSDEPFKKNETKVLHAFSLDHVIHCSKTNHVRKRGNLSHTKVEEYAILKNWVYKFLWSDMEELFKENRD